jgi:hypothetical protein
MDEDGILTIVHRILDALFRWKGVMGVCIQAF